MSVSTNIQTINANNTFQPKVNTTFKAQSVPVKDYPPDTVEINGKKKTGMSKGAKVGFGIGVIGTLALAIGLLAKGKTSQAKEVVNNVTVKQELQQKFGEIFKKDFSETEIDKLVENYKQIFKIDNVDDFSKRMFEQIKRDSGNESKNIEFVIRKCKPGMAEGGGYTPQNRTLFLDIEHENNIVNHEHKKLIFESLIHEFQHVRQYEMAYNADCTRFANAMTKKRDINEVIAFLEDALKRKTNLVSKSGGEQAIKEAITGLKANNSDYIDLYCTVPPEEKSEIIKNIKKSFGTPKQYDKNSENYKMGMKYLENWENYIIPTDATAEQYTQQIVEKEAFDAQYIAREILNLIKI